MPRAARDRAGATTAVIPSACPECNEGSNASEGSLQVRRGARPRRVP